jgi:hypothetical protein
MGFRPAAIIFVAKTQLEITSNKDFFSGKGTINETII